MTGPTKQNDDEFDLNDIELEQIDYHSRQNTSETRDDLRKALGDADICSADTLIEVDGHVLRRSIYAANLWDVYAVTDEDPDTWIWVDALNLGAYQSVRALEAAIHDLPSQ